ncbi:MotB family protein [Agrobacterium sp. ES01]|uniref:MotB family protein n=1 Tax=Agrobacterium sp. ES01 TaxID=3420714 RepID=UPI003D142C9B
MSDSENHHHGKTEILIIKRHGGGDHDGAHGGAWKIAYADFMTAMMAFFLVMWLVNAANEETKASVASYFNPIQLSEEKPAEKGLEKPVEADDGQETSERSKQKGDNETIGSAAATGDDQTATSGDQPNYSEADFFENPYSVLAEIAQEVGQQANVSAKGEGGAADSGPSTGADGGEAYRDPFDPDFWTQQVQNVEGQPGPKRADVPPAGAPADATENPDPLTAIAQQPTLPKPDQLQIVPQEKPAAETQAAELQASEQQPPAEDQPQEVAMVDPDVGNNVDVAAKTEDADNTDAAPLAKVADDLKSRIEKEISGIPGKLSEGLIVTPAEGGVLVTLSDQSDSPMFNVGSAVPGREMVLAMEKIGKILSDRPGRIIIRGHTDGRPFKGGDKDNWTLSMDRAHAAYYMLVRGGLQENRIAQVSGFADRRLQVPDDPLADANRRIEILIESDQPSSADRG